MAVDSIKIKFRGWIPAAGQAFNNSGDPVQAKQIVMAELNITDYTSGGESLTPKNLGLTTIDSISFSYIGVHGANGITLDTNTTVHWNYDPVNQKLIINTQDTTAGVTETTSIDPRVGVVAIGDSLTAPELLP